MKFWVTFLTLLLLACQVASASDKKTTIAISAGVFFPASSATRDTFEDSMNRISFKSFEPTKPTEWRFIAEVGSYQFDGPTEATLLPVTVGMERALSEGKNVQPYVTLRGGPYYGKVERPALGFSENQIGLNLNAAFGVTFSRRYFAEIRYDYFSRFAGINFDGFSISAGMRLFDIPL